MAVNEEIKKEIDTLVDDLNYFTDCYDIGLPEISDEEWDNMYFDLYELEKKTGYINPDSPTQKVHYQVVSELQKVKHNHPMLSLDKTKDEDEIKSFMGNKDCICMAKMDGLTCSLLYENGRLVRAETRGDGEKGEDITHNALVIYSIPKKINYLGKLVVDGEVICDYKTFEKIKNDYGYKHPRNFAVGALKRLDSKECNKAGLTFVAWDIISTLGEYITIDGNKVDDKLHLKLIYLETLGFTVVPRTGTWHYKKFSKLHDVVIEKSKELCYPIDGLVIKYDDVEYYKSLGIGAHHHYNGGIAFKFYDEEYETNLLDIEWSMSRTGTLTPVAIFDPIEIDGTTVSRASLSNVSVMWETLGKYPELRQKIWVSKRNQIIPKIERAEKNDIPHDHILPNGQVPTYCPICQGEVRVISEFDSISAICTEPTCPGKLVNIIDHYCDRTKGLDIRGLSKKTIEQLIEWGWVEEPIDLYYLKNFKDEWIEKPGFGVTSVTKILDAIEKSKTCRLENYISALGIPLVGLTVAKEICKYYETWHDFREAVGGRWSDLYGFGIGIENSINKYDYHMADRIAKMLNFIIPEEDNEEQTVEGMNFCITGKLSKKRDDIKADIEARGGKVTGSVSSKTNYLVCNDKNSTTGKSADAKKLNIPVITEEELNKLLGIIT